MDNILSKNKKINAFIKTCRPRQWTKNLLIFAAILFTEKDQMYLMKYIQSIYCYKGNLKDSDIAFIKKI